jgi:3-methyladenine DNA glycosylase AlkC
LCRKIGQHHRKKALNATRRFVKAMASQFVGQPEVREAEAHRLLITLQWTQHLQLNIVQIEIDCLNVVQSITRKMLNLTEFGSIIRKCKHMLNLIQNREISYVRRQANSVALELAQVARSYDGQYVFDYCSPCIETILINEINYVCVCPYIYIYIYSANKACNWYKQDKWQNIVQARVK